MHAERVRIAWGQMAREIGALMLPVACAGCGCEGESLCASCRSALTPSVTVRTIEGGLRVASGLRRDDVSGAVMHAFKTEGRLGLARPLAQALRVAVLAQRPVGEKVALVPIPSSREAFRRRGYRPVELVLSRAGFSSFPLLAVRRGLADQRQLGRADRAANMAGAFRVIRRVPADATGVILVDDVVTTGATLHAACLAIQASDLRVFGAATVLDTPRVFSLKNDR